MLEDDLASILLVNRVSVMTSEDFSLALVFYLVFLDLWMAVDSKGGGQ